MDGFKNISKFQKKHFSRRTLLVGAGAALPLALTKTALAQGDGAMDHHAMHGGHNHAMHGGHQHGGHHAGHQHHAVPHRSLAAAMHECIRQSHSWVGRCMTVIGGGDLSVSQCLSQVQEMQAMCKAGAQLATVGSQFLYGFLETHLYVGAACQDECLKFAQAYDECNAFVAANTACLTEITNTLKS